MSNVYRPPPPKAKAKGPGGPPPGRSPPPSRKKAPPPKSGKAPPPGKKTFSPPPPKKNSPAPKSKNTFDPPAPSSFLPGSPKVEETKDDGPPQPQRYRGITRNDDSDYDGSDDGDDVENITLTEPPSVPSGGGGIDEKSLPEIKCVYDDENKIHEGYVMRRLGAGPDALHYWEIRFCVLEKNKKGDTQLAFYTTHFMDTRKDRVIIKKGVALCMSFERDSYDEGRRRNLFAIQSKKKSSPVILDCATHRDTAKWLELFKEHGATDLGKKTANRVNPQSLKEGWIVTQGSMGTWHRRYMILLPQMAMYYRWKKDKRPLGVIPLHQQTSVKQVTGKGSFCLSLIPNANAMKGDPSSREYFIRCYDDQQLQAWINAFKKSIDIGR